jgi:hypothetical protein
MYLSCLLGMLLAASEPIPIRLRSPWTIHRALETLGRDAKKQGLSPALPAIEVTPDADVGRAVAGLVQALHELMAEGVLNLVGEGWHAAIAADRERLRTYRRQLMGLEPPLAELIYRAATAWAALSLTEEKNWARAMESLSRRRRSSTPNRRQGPVAVVL